MKEQSACGSWVCGSSTRCGVLWLSTMWELSSGWGSGQCCPLSLLAHLRMLSLHEASCIFTHIHTHTTITQLFFFKPLLMWQTLPLPPFLSLPVLFVQLLTALQNLAKLPWLVWLSGLSTGLWTKWSLVQFPIRAHTWVVGQAPSRGCERGNHTLMFLSLPSPLSKNK